MILITTIEMEVVRVGHPEMELALVKQVYARAAYAKGGDNLADKYKGITDNLRKLEIFREKGKPIGPAMMWKI